MTDDLFAPGVTYIEVKCWECGHTVTRKPEGAPQGITQHEFERRSVASNKLALTYWKLDNLG
tara:strand:+ start:345 stop:530 length:186 start_codon:yes stop_codon:yes gene_type:complete